MKRSVRPLVAALALVAATTACSSNASLRVVSNPPSSTVYLNGVRMGDTPLTVILPFDEHPRAFVQVTHPQRQSRMAILTVDTMPEDEERAFDLPVGN